MCTLLTAIQIKFEKKKYIFLFKIGLTQNIIHVLTIWFKLILFIKKKYKNEMDRTKSIELF